MSLVVYNLAREVRDKVQGVGYTVTLRAGYDNNSTPNPPMLFRGLATLIYHQVHQPEVLTHIECLDGNLSSFASTQIAVSYDQPILASQLIRLFAEKGEMVIGFIDIPKDKMINGWTGGVASYFNTIKALADMVGCTAYIENEELFVVPSENTARINDVIISQETGMVGFPSRFAYSRLAPDYYFGLNGEPSWKITTQLNGMLAIQSTIFLTSPPQSVFQQPAQVMALEHVGDSYGKDWFTHIECIEKGELS